MDQQVRLKNPPPVRPKPREDRPQKMFQHFDSEEERQAHLKYVEEAQRNGLPF